MPLGLCPRAPCQQPGDTAAILLPYRREGAGELGNPPATVWGTGCSGR